ncbi:hypothetical protein ASD54_12490 [Rhizobium sp. Root149]|nr:hypothetical protein ASD54_12490 [Rhizobium sp. Root149]
MTKDCVIRAFNGCDCAQGECRSATVPIIKILSKHEERARSDSALASIFTTANMAITGFGCAVIVLIGIFIGHANSAEAAKHQQEQVATWKR